MDDDQKNTERREAEERAAPSGKVVYQAILKEGREELARSTGALFWSGLAAGLSMGFSLITEALLRAYLPDKPWVVLISKLGYSVGFLIVILGRQQLFTENTLTPILPLMLQKNTKTLANVLRLWGVVLFANLLGGLAVTAVLTHSTALPGDALLQLSRIGAEALQPDFWTVVLRGIFAGWLLAVMVWLLPFAESARFFVVILITYVVGLGHFSHSIAGSLQAFAAAFLGEASWATAVGGFVIPSLLGNIIGGVTLVAAINHAQVVSGLTDSDL